MGWIAIGAVAATTCIFVYKYYPPSTWISSRPAAGQDNTGTAVPTKKIETSPLRKTASKAEDVQHTSLREELPEISPVVQPSPDSTPKAEPVTLQAQIPTFSLDQSASLDLSSTTTATKPVMSEREKTLVQPQPSSKASPLPVPTNSSGSVITSSTSSNMMPPPRFRPSAPKREPEPVTSPATSPSMPPPPRPNSLSAPMLAPPRSAASSLRAPPTASRAPAFGSSLMPTSSIMRQNPNKPSKKVILEPGHSPLDWAALTSNPRHELRGKGMPARLLKIPPSLLKTMNGRKGKDAWTSYNGRVYNITPYKDFHPGGVGELLRGAAKSSDKLFNDIHPWVNWDGMLSECMVGIMVAEGEGNIVLEVEGQASSSGSLDEMD